MPRFNDSPGTTPKGVAGTDLEVQSIQQIKFKRRWWLWTLQLRLLVWEVCIIDATEHFEICIRRNVRISPQASVPLSRMFEMKSPARTRSARAWKQTQKRRRGVFLELIDIQSSHVCIKAELGRVLFSTFTVSLLTFEALLEVMKLHSKSFCWFHPVKCEDLLLFFVIYERKRWEFGFWAVGWTEEVIWKCYFWFLEIMMSSFDILFTHQLIS